MSEQIDWTMSDLEEFWGAYNAWLEALELRERYWFAFDPQRAEWIASLEGQTDAYRSH